MINQCILSVMTNPNNPNNPNNPWNNPVGGERTTGMLVSQRGAGSERERDGFTDTETGLASVISILTAMIKYRFE